MECPLPFLGEQDHLLTIAMVDECAHLLLEVWSGVGCPLPLWVHEPICPLRWNGVECPLPLWVSGPISFRWNRVEWNGITVAMLGEWPIYSLRWNGMNWNGMTLAIVGELAILLELEWS